MDFIPWADASFRQAEKAGRGRAYERTESYCDYFGRKRTLGEK